MREFEVLDEVVIISGFCKGRKGFVHTIRRDTTMLGYMQTTYLIRMNDDKKLLKCFASQLQKITIKRELFIFR